MKRLNCAKDTLVLILLHSFFEYNVNNLSDSNETNYVDEFLIKASDSHANRQIFN